MLDEGSGRLFDDRSSGVPRLSRYARSQCRLAWRADHQSQRNILSGSGLEPIAVNAETFLGRVVLGRILDNPGDSHGCDDTIIRELSIFESFANCKLVF